VVFFHISVLLSKGADTTYPPWCPASHLRPAQQVTREGPSAEPSLGIGRSNQVAAAMPPIRPLASTVPRPYRTHTHPISRTLVSTTPYSNTVRSLSSGQSLLQVDPSPSHPCRTTVNGTRSQALATSANSVPMTSGQVDHSLRIRTLHLVLRFASTLIAPNAENHMSHVGVECLITRTHYPSSMARRDSRENRDLAHCFVHFVLQAIISLPQSHSNSGPDRGSRCLYSNL
jgi:hypothetical protein